MYLETSHRLSRRSFLGVAGLALPTVLGACARPRTQDQVPSAGSDEGSSEPKINFQEFEGLTIKEDAWNYDKSSDCYWQLGLNYCAHPATEAYEQLAIYVPAAYFQAEPHGKHFRCTPKEEDSSQGAFNTKNAPIVLAINSQDFAGQEAPNTFNVKGLKEYLDAGLVYVYVGLRGRSSGFDSSTDSYFSGGAPWAVCDIKAAIRFLRYNKTHIAGTTKRIVVFGHGSAAALASIVGASGNYPGFDPYLAEIGAITHDQEGKAIGDSIFGVASWCPLLPASNNNAAYEWMVGQYIEGGSREEGSFGRVLSEDLAAAYGEYLNTLGLVGKKSKKLKLDATGGGVYVAGSYYDALLTEIQNSLANYVKQAEFPIAISLSSQASGKFPGGGESLLIEEDLEEVSEESDNKKSLLAFETLEDYLAALNENNPWVSYDEETGDVRIASLGAFAQQLPEPRSLCAYDSPDKSFPMNQLYGTDDASGLHFDATIASLLVDKSSTYNQLDAWDESWPGSWREDLVQRDALDTTVAARCELYDPFFYLVSKEQDLQCTVAKHWRIRSGLQQAQTTLTGEYALSCCLAAHEDVAVCDFSFVWDRAFVPAEHTGTAAGGLVAWLESCTKKEDD